MLRVMAVDDNAAALDELAGLLRDDPRIEQVTAAGGAAEALRCLSRILVAGDRVDAVFLDVQMPGLDGLDVTRLLAGFAAPPLVVFVTSCPDFAVTAYELGAVDYMLKPVRPERLAEAVRRVDEVAHRTKEAPALDEVVPVELGGRTRLVSRSSITYAKAHGDYVRLYTAEASYLVRTPLVALARRWENAGFIRIHRSTLVAARHISEVRFDGGRVVVQVGEEPLTVSRRHTRQVRELLVRRFRQDPGTEN